MRTISRDIFRNKIKHHVMTFQLKKLSHWKADLFVLSNIWDIQNVAIPLKLVSNFKCPKNNYFHNTRVLRLREYCKEFWKSAAIYCHMIVYNTQYEYANTYASMSSREITFKTFLPIKTSCFQIIGHTISTSLWVLLGFF